jgi:Prokaryotic E2 family E
VSVLPSRCRKYLLDREIAFEEVDGPQKAIILRAYPVPSGRFNHDKADILIVLPNGYPDVRPDMFYAIPWLKLATLNRYPRAADQPYQFAGQSWQQWSRHNNQWRPGVDGIWTMLRRIDAALEAAA